MLGLRRRAWARDGSAGIVKLLAWGVDLGSSQRRRDRPAAAQATPKGLGRPKWKGRGMGLHSDASITSH